MAYILQCSTVPASTTGLTPRRRPGFVRGRLTYVRAAKIFSSIGCFDAYLPTLPECDNRRIYLFLSEEVGYIYLAVFAWTFLKYI